MYVLKYFLQKINLLIKTKIMKEIMKMSYIIGRVDFAYKYRVLSTI